MLADRSYMRDPQPGGIWPLTYVLMAANAGVFVLQSVLDHYRIFPVTAYLGLSLEGLKSGFLWQPITFQFLHGGVLHLLVNLIVIYFFGRAVEEALGRAHFLRLYLASGVIGGLFQMIFALLFPSVFGGVVVGASAGAFGLIAAFASMFPDRTITLLLFFVIPISLRARTLLWISIALAVFGIIVPVGNVADAAHLGGIFTGWAYIRRFILGQGLGLGTGWPSLRVRRMGPRELVGTRSGRRSRWRTNPPATEEDLPPAEYISRAVDPILDKISAHGIQSLTERERRILEAARARMSGRH